MDRLRRWIASIIDSFRAEPKKRPLPSRVLPAANQRD
jgi:hypothetical protein